MPKPRRQHENFSPERPPETVGGAVPSRKKENFGERMAKAKKEAAAGWKRAEAAGEEARGRLEAKKRAQLHEELKKPPTPAQLAERRVKHIRKEAETEFPEEMAQLHKQREEKKTTAQAEAARQRSRELRGKLKALKEEQNLREKILAPEEVGAVEITVEQEQEAQTRLEQIREEAKNLREAFRMANRRLLAASKEKMETLLSQLSELAANPAVERSDKAYQTAEDMLAHAERAYHEADERLNKPRVEPVAGEIKTGFFGKLKSFFMGGAKPGEETPEPKIREIETSFFELDEEMEAPQQLKDIERRATSLNEQLAKGLMRIDQADKALQQLQAEWEPFTKKSIAGKEEFFAAYKAMTNLQETMEKMRKEAGETKKTATRRKVA